MIKSIRSFFYTSLVLFTILSCSQETTNNEIDDKLKNDEVFVKESLALTKDKNQLVLTESSFGSLYLMGSGSEIQEIDLINAFSPFNIEIDSYGSNTEGDHISYIGWKGEHLFTLSLDKENNNESLNNLTLHSKGIVDVYGVKGGMTYNQLNLLRQGGEIKFNDMTGELEVTFNNSSILYTFCCTDRQQKTNFTEEDMQKMKIESIIWKIFS